ncbi:restriction endonuclease subunit S [Thermoleophilum album]|uniref:Type I restriction enzyme, S subunit n=1 Tax=Thermoleophilum album TaxID=29539 RepID=A0A1H6FRZ9_THEAL|nr:restriction endonuclease subunit S [Thermoleophilum album]SEH13669.1 type I restriction enzyme, S subunit [Thermoleophilum album]
MAGEWRECRIGEIADVVGGSTPPTKDPSNFNGDIPWLTPKDLAGSHDRYISRGERNLSRKGLERCSAKLLPPGTVLVTSRAPIGYVAIAKNPIATNQGFRSLIPKPGIDSEFLYYWIKANVEELRRHASGSTFQELTGSAFAQLRIRVPPLPEQRAIAHILGTLDDKIELNRRMSETLEQMARAIFKAWFVDFEPVRAKMEGRWRRGQSLPGLPAHLYDLFPDRLVDSELGEIPEGWDAARMGDVLAELVSGGRPKGGAVEEGVPSVGAENVIGLGKYDFSKEKYISRTFFEELQRKGAAVRPGDVLLYKDGAQIGRKTYFDCGFPHAECAVNEHVFILRAEHPRYQRYLFFWLDQDWMTQEIISLNSNSAQPGINQQGVRSLPCLIPPDPVLDAFDRLLMPLTDRLFSACLESRTLAALRDTLLPKLISGELLVKDAERFLERVAS